MLADKSASLRAMALVCPLLLLMVGACASDSAGTSTSGAPGETTIEELSEPELAQLCAWASERIEGENTVCPSAEADAAGGSGDAGDNTPSQGQGQAPASEETCAVGLKATMPACTVSDYEICVNSSIDDPCSADSSAACDKLKACNVSRINPPANYVMPVAGSRICSREYCPECWVSDGAGRYFMRRGCEYIDLAVAVTFSFGIMCGWVDCSALGSGICKYTGAGGANLKGFCTKKTPGFP